MVPRAGELMRKEARALELILTERERDLLLEMLGSEISEVRSELYHAEDAETKEMFRDREELAKRLRAKLEGSGLREPVVT